MRTYFIDGNGMHLAGSQIDISDNFFGSESPKSDATDSQRQDAIRFWLSKGWMDDGDVVIWDGVQYIVGGESKSHCVDDKDNIITISESMPNNKPKRIKRRTNRLTRKEIKELIKKKKQRGIIWEC